MQLPSFCEHMSSRVSDCAAKDDDINMVAMSRRDEARVRSFGVRFVMDFSLLKPRLRRDGSSLPLLYNIKKIRSNC